MSFLEKVQAKYPRAKQSKHTGDSYMMYEAGSRDPLHPFSSEKFDELVKETEGDEADANRNFEVNHQDLKRTDGGFPDERSMDDPFGLLARDRLRKRGASPTKKIAPGPDSHGYPTETGFWYQALSSFVSLVKTKYRVKRG